MSPDSLDWCAEESFDDKSWNKPEYVENDEAKCDSPKLGINTKYVSV